MTRRFLTLIAVTATTASLLAQGTAGRFQRERNAEVTTPGQQRLDVDVALLQGSQPFTVISPGERFIAAGGLNDLRLFSANGPEVPYLLVPPSPDVPQFASGRVLPITATDTPNVKASGFEVDFETVAIIDAIDLGRVPAPFLKRFRLEGERRPHALDAAHCRRHGLQPSGGTTGAHADRVRTGRVTGMCASPGTTPTARVWPPPDVVTARRVTHSSSGTDPPGADRHRTTAERARAAADFA